MKRWLSTVSHFRRALPVALLFAAHGAAAGDAVDVRVTASVLAICKIQSVKDIQFGTLDPSQAVNASAEGAVAFMCTKGVDYRLIVDKGQNYDTAAARRRMKSTDGSFLPYALAAESFSGTGAGFRTPINVPLSASIRGSDYIDLPAVAFTDVVRLVLEP
jgi:spore coat protein U-like protein